MFGGSNYPASLHIPPGYGGGYSQNTTTYTYTSGGGSGRPTTTTTYSYGQPTVGGFSQQPSAGGFGFGTTGYGGYGGYGQPTSNYGQPTRPSVQPTRPSVQPTSNYGQPTGYPGYGGQQQPSTNYSNYGQQNGRYGGTTISPAKPKLNQDEIKDLSRSGKEMFSNAFSQSSTPAKSGYADLLRQLKSSGQKHKDLEFPAELRSLTGGLSDYELAQSGNDLNWRSIVWQRPDEFFGRGKYNVFLDKVEPNDIKQGSLGDCYFLSTLAALAEKPERIRSLFESTEVNDQGCYAVRVCDVGVWTTIILDDQIPCSGKSRQPIFTRGNGNELWVLLLEKAWAKIYGSYARIEAGLTRECLHDLTGAPTKYYLTGDDPKKNEEIWKEISNGEQRDYVMTCGSGDFFEGADLMGSAGLVGSHAYALLAALTVKDKYGSDVRLVKLRNPWGQGEWTGAWSDKSSEWTPELKRKLNIEDRDDGTFYMAYRDMLKYFSDIQICKVHDNYSYNSLKSSCDHRHATFFKLTVRQSGHYFITINQESKRKHAERENYRYSEVSVVFGRKTGNGYEYVEGIQKADKEVWTDGHMDAGEYVVYVKIHWNEQKTKEFSISSYGVGAVDIQQVPKTFCPEFIERVYISKGRKSEKKEDYKHCGVTNCYRAVELTDDGFGFIYYRNESNRTLEEEIYFKAMEGLKFKKPYTGNNYKITVPPNQGNNGATCDSVNGRCICAPGFMGPTCDDHCVEGSYGVGCEKKCDCLNNNKCDPISGKCLCVGWTGEKCALGCPRGTYGPMCSLNCSSCNGLDWKDSNAACNPVTGECVCERGYTGKDCKDRVCAADMYGLDCLKQCPCVMENTEMCAPDTGFCRCKRGFTGDACERRCSRLQYGPGCSKSCDCPLNTTTECHPETGKCFCLPGLTGSLCNEPCPPGKFGLDCAFNCKCEHGTCNSKDGTCDCEKGFHGPTCAIPCPSGSFGPACAPCQCKNGAGCDPVDGKCYCLSGWTGLKCETPCPDNTYGPDCSLVCRCKNGGKCNRETGVCACERGWTGADCSTQCAVGMYGDACEKQCDCNGASCQQKTGKCICPAGKTGGHCDEDCIPGHFGFGCRETCRNCTLDEHPTVCAADTGYCQECPPGKIGEFCEEICPPGKYGAGCLHDCKCSDGHKCDPLSGECSCEHGFTGDRCEDKCPSGKWGVGCANDCPACANGAECSSVDGTCRCPPGYEGRTCDRVCVSGSYGLGCSKNCTCSSPYKQCDPFTGECSCPPGWQGDQCNKECEDGYFGPDCINKCKCKGTSTASCHRVTGACQCHAGFTGDVCHALCSPGFFGLKCTKECGDCGDGYICDPAIGCCRVDQVSCGEAQKTYEALMGGSEKKSGVFVLILVVSAILSVLLTLMVLYYRRQYHKEKDPTFATVVYHPKDDEANEIENPMYKTRESMVDPPALRLLTEEEEELENKKIRGRTAVDRAQNEYASLDDVVGTSSSSSNRGVDAPLLRAEATDNEPSNSAYEVPSYRNSLNSPDRVAAENEANALRNGNLYT